MTWKIGHRGACGHAPENTLLSMRKALEFGVHGRHVDDSNWLTRELTNLSYWGYWPVQAPEPVK